jgi:hypothetical protein
MSTLIKVGCLVMTPEQFQRALAEDMTVSQAQEMIRRENAEKSDTEKEEENV